MYLNVPHLREAPVNQTLSACLSFQSNCERAGFFSNPVKRGFLSDYVSRHILYIVIITLNTVYLSEILAVAAGVSGV